MDPYKYFFDKLGIIFNYNKWPERFLKVSGSKSSIVFNDTLTIKLFKKDRKFLKQKDKFLIDIAFFRNLYDEFNSPNIYAYVFKAITRDKRLYSFFIDAYKNSFNKEDIELLFNTYDFFPNGLPSCEEIDLILTLNGFNNE